MAKLYFHYSTMNAGKSTLLLQASYNYVERGMQTYLLTANFDDRAGTGRSDHVLGSGRMRTPLHQNDLFSKIQARLNSGPCCVFIDEAQFCPPIRFGNWPALWIVEGAVMCYGLRVDFQEALSRFSSTFGIGGRDARDTHYLPLREKGDDGRATGRKRKRVERRRAGTSWRK